MREVLFPSCSLQSHRPKYPDSGLELPVYIGPDIDSLSQEQTVAVEKDLFNIVPQDYITNYQWKLKIAKTLPNLRKD